MESNWRNQNIQSNSLMCFEGGEYEMEGGDDEDIDKNKTFHSIDVILCPRQKSEEINKLNL